MTAPPLLERISKAAAVVSVVGVLFLSIAIHPDLTWSLRMAAIAAFVLGWFGSGVRPDVVQLTCLLAAPLAPALLRGLTGLEGPVLDLVWMAGLTASVLRTTAWSRWAIPPGWRVPAGGWALALALSWPILAAREAGFDVQGLWDMGRINSDRGITAPHAVMWTLSVVWTQLAGLLWMDATSERLAREPNGWPLPVHGLWIGGTLATLVALYQGVVSLEFANSPFWAAQARATGTLLDANAYGLVAALSGPMACLVLIRRPGRSTMLAAGVLVANLAGVWLSGSRTATVCAGIGTLALVAALSRSAAISRRVAPAAVAGLVLAVLVLALAGNAVGPVRRLLELPGTPVAALSDILTRGPYGTVAAQVIREYPWTGVGAGGYNIMASDYWRTIAHSGLPFDNAQNWWRQVAAEAGILGGLWPMVLSALLAWCVLRGSADPARRRTATFVRGLLAALGVCSLIQMPTQTPIVMLWCGTLAGWLPSLLVEDQPSRWRSLAWPRASWIAVGALAIAFAGGHVALAVGPLDPAARARWMNRELVRGGYQPEPRPDSETGRFRWTRQEARFEWPVSTRWLVVQFWLPHPDVASRPVRVTLASPCGTIFDEEIATSGVVGLALRLPASPARFEMSSRVSRTYRPSANGLDDSRPLGLGIAADFVNSESDAASHRLMDLPACKG